MQPKPPLAHLLGVALPIAALLAPSLASQASYTSYRQSCPGALGTTPQLTASAPMVAAPWTLTVTRLSPSTPGALFFGLRDDVFGGSRLPFDLGYFGAPGCDLNIDIDPTTGASVLLVASDATGEHRFTYPVPNAPGLLGFTYFNQYASLEAPPGRALAITTTNAGRGVIGQFITNSLGMQFVRIPAGTFTMGSPTTEPGRGSDEVQHQVTLTQPFYMQTTEVTQAQWQAVMGSNPSFFRTGVTTNRPVEQASWYDVQAFLTALNALEPGAGYRLPTEAEWEYACRAGTTTAYSFGNDWTQLGSYAWYGSNSGNQTHDVATKLPNPWGLYDMHGNVWEWCQDWYGAYPTTPVTDPQGPLSGSYRVVRGGAWLGYAGYCRSAGRLYDYPSNRSFTYGFRLVRPSR